MKEYVLTLLRFAFSAMSPEANSCSITKSSHAAIKIAAKTSFKLFNIEVLLYCVSYKFTCVIHRQREEADTSTTPLLCLRNQGIGKFKHLPKVTELVSNSQDSTSQSVIQVPLEDRPLLLGGSKGELPLFSSCTWQSPEEWSFIITSISHQVPWIQIGTEIRNNHEFLS